MVRDDGNSYARFKDTPQTANATAVKEGNVELVQNGAIVSEVCDVEKQDASTKVLAAVVRKIYICLVMLCIVVIVLLVFTATNFVLIMENRNNVVPQKSQQQDTTETTQYHIQLRDEVEMNPEDPLSQDFMASDHLCEVFIVPACYWLSSAEKKNFQKAIESCQIDGGEVGVVHSGNYQFITRYIRKKSDQDTSSVWLGMTRDSTTGDIQVLNHGKYEDPLQWLPGYPATESDATSVCLQTVKNANSTSNGFFNVNPQSRDIIQSILCEMPWNDGGQSQDDYEYTRDSAANSTEY